METVAILIAMQSFIIEQKIKPLVNQYAVFGTADDGSKGAMIAFAQQKRFAFKEAFTMYADDSKKEVTFTAKARQVMDFGARYDVTDANGNVLGTIGKAFKSSLLRSTWHVYAPGKEDTPLLVVQERSKGLAIFRRIWDFIPYIGDIPFLLKYHFDMTDPDNGQVAATYEKTTLWRDHYRLQVIGGPAEAVDSRVLLSLGILLDAMQSR